MAQKRIIIGNANIAGFVNFVADKRFVVGTGSYTNKDNEKVFKESVTVFLDDKFDGKVPAKGDYIEVRGDLNIAPRNDKPEELNATMNVRFGNQIAEKEAPRAKATADAAPAAGDDI